MRCFVCSCSEEQSCPGGCGWSAEGPNGLQPLCTSCHRIAQQLGHLLASVTKRQELANGLGWTVLAYLVLDAEGPRVTLNRWQRILIASEVPPPPPSYAELWEFLSRGRQTIAAIERAMADGQPPPAAAVETSAELQAEAAARTKGRNTHERRKASGKMPPSTRKPRKRSKS